jgi:hypothetical protein
MILLTVILSALLTAALIGFGITIGWRAARDQTPIAVPDIRSIRVGKRAVAVADKPSPTVKPQENP